MKTKLYFLLTGLLPPLWRARLDNSIASPLWRERQLAKAQVFIKRTTRNYERRYEEGGLEKLVNDYYMGRSSYLSSEEQSKLIVELESKIYLTTKSI